MEIRGWVRAWGGGCSVLFLTRGPDPAIGGGFGEGKVVWCVIWWKAKDFSSHLICSKREPGRIGDSLPPSYPKAAAHSLIRLQNVHETE